MLLFPDPVEFILLPPSLKRLLFWSAARPKLHTYINKHAEKLPPDSARGENLKQLKVFTECGEFQKKSTHQDSVLLLLDWRWLAAKERKILKVMLCKSDLRFIAHMNTTHVSFMLIKILTLISKVRKQIAYWLMILLNCSLVTLTSSARSVKLWISPHVGLRCVYGGSGGSDIFMQSLECGVISSTSVSRHKRPPTTVNDHRGISPFPQSLFFWKVRTENVMFGNQTEM